MTPNPDPSSPQSLKKLGQYKKGSTKDENYSEKDRPKIEISLAEDLEKFAIYQFWPHLDRPFMEVNFFSETPNYECDSDCDKQ